MPTDTVFSYPNALPIVMTVSPTIRSDEVPILIAASEWSASTFRIARSITGQTGAPAPGSCVPSNNWTTMPWTLSTT